MTISSLYNPTPLFAGSDDFEHRLVTVLSGQTLKRGTVVGRITASDKYKLATSGASDGSQLAATFGIVAADVDASGGDTVAPVYFQGEFAFEAMTVDSSFTFATLDAALRAAASQIYVRSVGVNG